MTERFKKAYDSLVRAFFEGTLAKGTCVGCACGNIIFDAVGESVTKKDIEEDINSAKRHYSRLPKRDRAFHIWANKRTSRFGKWKALSEFSGIVNEAGYTAEEFAKIENAFESNTRINFTRYPDKPEQDILEDQYEGLCAVVDVLIELDEGKEDPDEFKKKFREHPKLVTS